MMTRATDLEATEGVFNQAPPLQDHNRYLGHAAMRDALARECGPAVAAAMEPALARLGEELASADWITRGELANRHPPELRLYDAQGRRLDRFDFHPAWHDCLDWLKRNHVAGAAWADEQPGAQTKRAALFQLFAEVECGSLCPATMTHAALPLLMREPALAEPWLRLALAPAHDPRFIPAAGKRGLLIGMGLTERQGGSDVRANISRADPAGDGWYRITGHKWFFSVAMSDAFLVTAQGADGLGCYFMPRFLPDGSLNALHLVRAKDKLGDRSNASAEVRFDGALALPLGEQGRGIATIIEMASYTRLDCANGSAGIMRAALAHALHHARHRQAFGKPLIAQPLMAQVLADMAVEVEGHVALCLRVAATLDRQRDDAAEAALKRLLTPVAKYWVCKRSPALVAEAMEVLGGNGYVEESPMPRLFRQSPLNAIWEGASNIMCLDVLRALARDKNAGAALAAELAPARGRHPAYDRHLDRLGKLLAAPQEADARRLTEAIALAVSAARLLQGDGIAGEAFCLGRLQEGAGSNAFGGGPALDTAALLQRARPDPP
ncbi:isovaleryl-CoA dehydrogenase [Azoarcus indigens]|uniref:Putative acyl-CoA dehydrogenase n=1 Tax=Azoarcus indigens TaxID=29545 RepID=A0A4R6DSR1_9RHOO|nr:isovaleryl-CoA dehydrogenase [Azoarcus indigens]TDN48136.1 putative acyl-CoA dehydrogenase [Azoarcus indigens]